MNRAEFFAVLRRELSGLPKEEMENALVYYTEYLDDAGVEDNQPVPAELGEPSAIAAQIRLDYAGKYPLQVPPAKKGMSGWWIVLMVFAIPIGLPLAIAGIAVAFSLLIVLFALLFSFGAAALALFVAGLGSFIFGCLLFPATFLGALFVIGAGFALIGLSLLFGALVWVLGGAAGKGLQGIMNSIVRRRKGGQKNV